MSQTIYIRPTSNFTMVSNGIFRDNTISIKAVGLYCQIASLPDRCKPSVQYLVSHHTDGKASITAAMDELCKAGWMMITTARNNGRFVGSVWQLTNEKGVFEVIEEPSKLFQDPDSGSPDVDLPYPDFRHPEESPQIKTILKEDVTQRILPPTPATPFGGTPDPLDNFPRLKAAYPKINRAILRNHPKAIIPEKDTQQELKAKKALAALAKLDKYTEDEICKTLNWVLNLEPDGGGFTWRDQFRSITQLREVKGGATKFTKMCDAFKKATGVVDSFGQVDPMVAEGRRQRALGLLRPMGADVQ